LKSDITWVSEDGKVFKHITLATRYEQITGIKVKEVNKGAETKAAPAVKKKNK